jgi:hypothetical protein
MWDHSLGFLHESVVVPGAREPFQFGAKTFGLWPFECQ